MNDKTSKKRIAILGGSFNPVHNGHLSLAENVHLELGYETIVFFPAFISPFKQGAKVLNENSRLALLNNAIEDNPHFMVDDFELKKQGVSYTIDTVEYCYKTYNIEGKLGLIIGADLLPNILGWNQSKKLLSLVDLIVGKRPTKTVVENGKKKNRTSKQSSSNDECLIPEHRELQNEVLQISSTYIRSAIASNKAWQYLVPQKVYKLIVENGYYLDEK